MIKNNCVYYLVSCLMHILILCAGIFFLDFSSETVVMGDQVEQSVSSYIYKGDIHQQYPSQNKTAVKNNNVIAMKKSVKSLEKKSLSTPEVTKSASSPSASSSSSKGAQVDGLLAVLHTAIQKQQHY